MLGVELAVYVDRLPLVCTGYRGAHANQNEATTIHRSTLPPLPATCLPLPLPLDGWTLRSHENSEHLKTTIVLARAAVCDIWFATPQPNSRTVRTPSTCR